MSDQDLLTTIKFTVDGSGVESGLTSVKRSIKDLGDAVKSISDKTNDALGKVGTTDLPVAKGLTKASKDIIKQTGDIEKAIATFGSAASTSLRSAYKSIEAEEVRMRGMGIDPAIMNPYLEKLKEVQKLSAAVANQDRKIAAEQAAAQQKIFDTEAHYAALKVQHAAHNKSIADQEIASTKARADALKAYYTEAQNAELNLIHTGRGKSSAMLTDKGQRLGFTDAEINTAVSGLKRVEEANKTAFAAANPHLEKLRAQAEASNTSVKGLTASLRNVPAQFTDIIVSLQGGQAPLTVLLQQGGQLKDMFGGVGNAAIALGHYVLGLVNPFTLTAGAAAALYMAYSAGSDEARAFNKSLITTGNAAGVTAGQLAAMAQSVSLATGGTVGSASGALASLAGSKNIAAGQFEKIAALAVQMEKATGVAVDKTVEKFAELGKDPVGASEKLNQSINYLTASVYEQIKALTDQGRTLEAGIVAQDAFFEVNRQRTAPLLENLSRTTQAYKILAGWVAKVADVAKEPFRAPDIMADLSKQIAIREGFVRNKFTGEVDATDKTLIGLKEQFAYHKHITDSQRDYAAAQAESIKRDEASIAISKEADKYATKQVQLQREIAKAASDYNNSNRTSKDLENYEKLVVGIQNKFKETPASAKAAKAASDAYMSLYESLLKNNEQSLIELDTGTKITAGAREHLDALKQINAEYRKGKIGIVESEVLKSIADETSANRARAEANKEAIKADQDGYRAMHDLQKQAEADYKTSAKAAQEYILTAQEYADVAAMEANLVGLNTEQRKLAIEQYKIEADWKKEIARIDGMSNQSDAQKAELKAQYSAAMISKLNASTTKSFQDQWLTASDSIRDSLINSFDDAILTGKSLFTSLRDAAVKLFDGLVLRPVLQGVMAPAATALTGSLIGTAANAATGASATSGLLGNAASLASLGSSFGDGFMATLGGSSISGGGAAALLSGGSSMSGMVGAAAPYALAALAVAKLLSGPGFTSAADSGRARIDYSSTGIGSSAYSTTGSAEQITARTANTNALAKSYFDTAKALGIAAIQGAFEVGTNTGREGAAPNTVIGATFGSAGYSSGEVSSADTAGLALAANRAVLTALQASELPGYLADVFNGITASTASQDQITASLQYAQSLKTVRDALLETRTPLQILQDTVATGFTSLGTSAETFKTDFVAAIDGGLSADNLAKWQGLQSSMTSLAATAATVSDTMRSLTQANANLSDQWDKLTLSQDAYRAKTIAGYTEQEQAQARANYAIEDSIAAYNAQATANQQAADAAATLAAQVIADAQARAAAILSERQGLQDQYDTLTMTSAQLLDKQRSALDASNQSLFDNIQALNAQAAANEQAIADNAASRSATLTGASTAATEAYAALQRAVSAQQASDAAAYEAQKAIATAAYTSQQSVMQASIDATTDSLDAVGKSVGRLQSLSSSLKSTLDGLRIAGSDTAYRADAQAQIRAALATARSGGGLPLDGQLTSALATVSKPSEQLFGSFEAYARDFYATANDIAALNDLTGAQLSAGEAQQAAMQAQLAVLTDQKSLLKDGFADQVSALDDILKNAQRQLDAANGLDVSVMSVADALVALGLSIEKLATERTAQGLATASPSANTAADYYTNNKDVTAAYAANSYGLSATDYANVHYAKFGADEGRASPVATPAATAKSYFELYPDVAASFAVNAYGLSAAAFSATHYTNFGKAEGRTYPGFAQGINYVPNDMTARIHEGEAVVPKAYNPYNPNAQQSGNNETAAALRELADRLDRIEANTRATAGHTAGTDRKLARVIPGNALITEAA